LVLRHKSAANHENKGDSKKRGGKKKKGAGNWKKLIEFRLKKA